MVMPIYREQCELFQAFGIRQGTPKEKGDVRGTEEPLAGALW